MMFRVKELLSQFNLPVFLPPFMLLLVALLVSLLLPKQFLIWVTAANDWILQSFDWAFSYTSFFMVLLCLAVCVSPVGKVKIGGAQAVPLLSRWRWFSIILCTSVAVGILFWGTAEPLFHMSAPPELMRDYSESQLQAFTMSTMFMHWSFTPYAIYCIPAVLFALAYYNRKRTFSLVSMLFPVLNSEHRLLNVVVNVFCLFALVAGMAASLGAGLLSVSGGLARYFNLVVEPLTIGVVALTVVGTFTVSAASGLLKGIKWLSSFNILIFILLAAFILFFGPTGAILDFGLMGLKSYIIHFMPHSLGFGDFADTDWTHTWTTFYWANWMAWAPVTALFLGRLGYGYTVRQFMLFNWVLPSLFSMLWMSVFSGTVLHQQAGGLNLVGLLNSQGPQSVIYQMIQDFPLAEAVSGIFILTMFVSYVTAADSNTMAMSGLSSKVVSPENPEPSAAIKYLWGIVVGVVAWVMVSYSGVDGVKMLSNLGGLPAMMLLIACSISMVKLLIKPH